MSTASLRAALAVTTVLTGCGSDPPGADRSYVLVHGAWMGPAGWDPVAARLRDEGAEVVIPELPAHGGDPTPAAAATLTGYVDRVAAALATLDRPAILVGHSMAGVVISEVAERHPDQVAALVYIAAYVPTTGHSVLELAMTDPDAEVGPSLVFNPDGTVGIQPDAFPDLFCADCDPDGRAALVAGYRDEPGAPLGEPVTLGAAFAAVPKTYVHTSADRVVSPALQAAMVGATPVTREVSVATSHVPMLADPDAIAAALLAD